jgi:thioredoxin-dependent peroxiredoxin
MNALTVGSKAPKFTLPLVTGGEFSLQEALAKSPVVVAFFKISCPVCQWSFPLYDRLAQRLKEAGVTMIAISQDDRESTRDFMKRFGVNFPVALDGRGYPVSNAYGLTNVPTVFEIQQDGVIATSSVSWARGEMEAILAKYADASAKSTPLFSPREDIAEYRVG